MEKVTTKILDNTVITASLNEIKCIDLIKKCSEGYKIGVTFEVIEECKMGFKSKMLRDYLKIIQIHNLTGDKIYLDLVEYLLVRYPYLHIGEVSSFLLALLKYELNNVPYYFITDDNKMRKVISNIHKDLSLSLKLRYKITNFRITGTIGLMKRMFRKGIISREDIENIITDLEKSTFYITPKLINCLRGC